MELCIIVAMDQNGVIGVNGTLPWHLPRDMTHFRTLTAGHTVIMGRKTYESIGRPLPKRQNIVISNTAAYPHVQMARTFEEALGLCEPQAKVFAIGGSAVYKSALEQAQTCYITRVHTIVTGDTMFPTINWEQWAEVERMHHAADSNNEFGMDFITYKK